MRIFKIWILAQLLNLLPYLYFLNESEGIAIIALVGCFSLIGGIGVLTFFAIADTIIVEKKTSAKNSYLISLILFPLFTALFSFATGYVFTHNFTDLLPFTLVPVGATFIAVLVNRSLYKETSDSEIQGKNLG